MNCRSAIGTRIGKRKLVVFVALICAAARIGGDSLPKQSAAYDGSAVVAQVNPTKKPKPKPAHSPVSSVPKEGEAPEDTGPPKPPTPVEYENVKLANGTEIQVEKWGDQFAAPVYHEAPDLNDKRVHEIIWFKNANLGGGPTSMQVDSKGDKLYWSNAVRTYSLGRIMHSDLDGKHITTLIDKLPDPHDLVLDLQHKQMYWLQGLQSKHSLMTADLNGKHAKAIVEGLDSPRGLALDATRGELYYWEHPGHIVRVKTDGTGEQQFVAEGQGFYLNASPRALYWHDKEQSLYWMDASGYLQRAARDQPEAKLVFKTDMPNKHDPFAIDSIRQQVFIIDSIRGQLSRINMDGSERELLVTGVARNDLTTGRRGVAGAVAVDEQHDTLYFTGGHYDGTSQWTGLFRVKLPPRQNAIQKAPPLITGISPEVVTHSDKMVVRGENLSPTKAVVFVDDSTCEHLTAKYETNDDGSLTVIVPKLGDNCQHPLLIVETPSGVTMTLKKDLTVAPPGLGYGHSRLKTGPLPQIWLPPDTQAGDVETAVVYINQGAIVSVGTHGQTLAFAKNGSTNGCIYRRKCVVYHEPFAKLGPIKDKDRTTVLHPVPAIRPSFLDTPVTYHK